MSCFDASNSLLKTTLTTVICCRLCCKFPKRSTRFRWSGEGGIRTIGYGDRSALRSVSAETETRKKRACVRVRASEAYTRRIFHGHFLRCEMFLV